MSPDKDRRHVPPFDENDDGLDLPTYDPDQHDPEKRQPRRRPRRMDPYARVGRVAPQSIPPRDGEAARPTEGTAVPLRQDTSGDGTASKRRDAEPEAGRRIKPAAAKGTTSRDARLASDAPTEFVSTAKPQSHPETSTYSREHISERQPQVVEPLETEVLPAADAEETVPARGDARGDKPEETDLYAAAASAGPAGDGEYLADEAADSDYEDDDLLVEEDTRRGTLNLGLLLLRLTLGLALAVHSLGIFFQLGSSEGLAGLSAEYSGYPWGGALAIAIPAAELAAGVFVTLGLITPVFTTVGLVATGFNLMHAGAQAAVGFDVFSWPEHIWVAALTFGTMLALHFAGPGTWSIDYPRGWARRPLMSSWVGLIIAAIALGLIWWFGAATSPF